MFSYFKIFSEKKYVFMFRSFSVEVPKEKAKPVLKEKGTYLVDILIQNSFYKIVNLFAICHLLF